MLTIYHAPKTRSSRVLWLLEELEAPYEIKKVSIARQDGSSVADPANPHPEGKVPALVDDGILIMESAAIFLYLTDKFPKNAIGPLVGDPRRGPYLTWLAYYAGVIEPVVTAQFIGLADNPAFTATFRGRAEMDARILNALKTSPYLLGDAFSAADIILASVGHFARQMLPAGPVMDAFLARVSARPALARAAAKDD